MSRFVLSSCEPVLDRPRTPPPREGHRHCTYYEGCPSPRETPRIQPCAPALDIVGVRELRAEGGRRALGSPIAVRGFPVIGPYLVSILGRDDPAGREDGKCAPERGKFVLAADVGEPCLCTHLVLPETLWCIGDHTDRCCHANAALPAEGTIAVAVGTYLGPARVVPTGEADDIAVEYFCTLPAKHESKVGTP